MIEIKLNKTPFVKYSVLLSGILGCFIFANTFFILKDDLHEPEVQSGLIFTFLFCLILFMVSKAYYSLVENYVVTFNDNGISGKLKINVGFIVFINTKYNFSWEDVSKLAGSTFGFFGGDISIRITTSENILLRYKSIIFTNLMTHENKKEALEFILTKIPTDKVTKSCRRLLMKKYGIFVDE